MDRPFGENLISTADPLQKIKDSQAPEWLRCFNDSPSMFSKAPKECQGCQKAIQKKRKENDIRKRSAWGRQPEFGGLGPRHFFNRFVAKIIKDGANIETNNHQESMQKQVPQKDLNENINKHDLLMWKSIEIHCKQKLFLMTYNVGRANETGINKSSNMITKSIKKGIKKQ